MEGGIENLDVSECDDVATISLVAVEVGLVLSDGQISYSHTTHCSTLIFTQLLLAFVCPVDHHLRVVNVVGTSKIIVKNIFNEEVSRLVPIPGGFLLSLMNFFFQ